MFSIGMVLSIIVAICSSLEPALHRWVKWVMDERHNYQIHDLLIQVLMQQLNLLINLIIVSSKVLSIPLLYSKVISKGDIATAQLFTLRV